MEGHNHHNHRIILSFHYNSFFLYNILCLFKSLTKNNDCAGPAAATGSSRRLQSRLKVTVSRHPYE